LVPSLPPLGAWAEPGNCKDASTEMDTDPQHDDTPETSLPSSEACEKASVATEQPIAVAGEQLASDDVTESLDNSFDTTLPSLTSLEACGGNILNISFNSQLVTPSLTP